MSDQPLLEFLEVMRRLRTECPWKSEQTHESLARYLTEELHETLAAIESGTPADLCDELGDLLLQVYFHAVIAEENGDFTLDDVAAGISAKLKRRSPHVFDPASLGRTPDSPPLTPDEVNEIWQQAKNRESDSPSPPGGWPEAANGR